jgi:hypothetical protein
VRTLGLIGAAGGLFCALLAVSPAHSQVTPKNHAIVIGIDKYPTVGDVEALSYAVADARAMERILKKNNYEVTTLLGDFARRENILIELGRLAATANEVDAVLVYFAGHGVRRKLPRSNQTYWLTYGASLGTLEVGGMRIAHLIDFVNEIPARRKILILDHCHSGEVDVLAAATGSRSANGTPGWRNLFSFEKDNFARELSNRGADGLVVFAAATEKAFEMPGLGHGLYTHLLIRGLEAGEADVSPKDGKITVSELREFLKSTLGAAATTNNVKQDSVDFMRGENLNWVLVEVGDPMAELRELLGTLQVEGKLSSKVAVLYFRAIQAIQQAAKANVAPDPEFNDFIEYLKSIRDLGTGDSAVVKAQMLETWVAGRRKP